MNFPRIVGGTLLGVVMLAAACDREVNPLAGTTWQLAALGDVQRPAAVVGEATARFTTAADLTGWTGCNAYGANYRVRGTELHLDELKWTERGCPSDALFRQEQRMQAALATVTRFELDGDRLTLHSDSGHILIYSRAPPADQS